MIKVLRKKGKYYIIFKNKTIICDYLKDLGKELFDLIIEECPNTYKNYTNKQFLTKKELETKTQKHHYKKLCNGKYVSLANNKKVVENTFSNIFEKIGIDCVINI